MTEKSQAEEAYQRIKEGGHRGGEAGGHKGGVASQQATGATTYRTGEEATGTGIDRIPVEKAMEGAHKGGTAGGGVQHERAEAAREGRSSNA